MFPACVVFADISGFTPLTEYLVGTGPEVRVAWDLSLLGSFYTSARILPGFVVEF